MSKTKRYREQHIEMLNLVKKAEAFLDSSILTKDSKEVYSLILSLFAILDSHLAMEDNVVYPLLLKSSDDKVKSLAMKFSKEINIIGKVLTNYKNPGLTQSVFNQTLVFLFCKQMNCLMFWHQELKKKTMSYIGLLIIPKF